MTLSSESTHAPQLAPAPPLTRLPRPCARRSNIDLYKAEFESAFIAATELYYRTESAAFVAANSVTDYMKKAETRLKEEEDRVEMYLHPATRARLIKKCENALIGAHAQLLWDEFDKLLEADKGDGESSGLRGAAWRLPIADRRPPRRHQQTSIACTPSFRAYPTVSSHSAAASRSMSSAREQQRWSAKRGVTSMLWSLPHTSRRCLASTPSLSASSPAPSDRKRAFSLPSTRHVASS